MEIARGWALVANTSTITESRLVCMEHYSTGNWAKLCTCERNGLVKTLCPEVYAARAFLNINDSYDLAFKHFYTTAGWRRQMEPQIEDDVTFELVLQFIHQSLNQGALARLHEPRLNFSRKHLQGLDRDMRIRSVREAVESAPSDMARAAKVVSPLVRRAPSSVGKRPMRAPPPMAASSSAPEESPKRQRQEETPTRVFAAASSSCAPLPPPFAAASSSSAPPLVTPPHKDQQQQLPTKVSFRIHCLNPPTTWQNPGMPEEEQVHVHHTTTIELEIGLNLTLQNLLDAVSSPLATVVSGLSVQSIAYIQAMPLSVFDPQVTLHDMMFKLGEQVIESALMDTVVEIDLMINTPMKKPKDRPAPDTTDTAAADTHVADSYDDVIAHSLSLFDIYAVILSHLKAKGGQAHDAPTLYCTCDVVALAYVCKAFTRHTVYYFEQLSSPVAGVPHRRLLMPELSLEEEQLIRRTLLRAPTMLMRHDRIGRVILNSDNMPTPIECTQDKMGFETLREGQWLSSFVIDTWLHSLAFQMRERGSSPLVLNYMFWQKLFSEGYAGVCKWFRKHRAAGMKVDSVLGVVHVSGGTHWAAVFVDLCRHRHEGSQRVLTFEFQDSLRGLDRPDSWVSAAGNHSYMSFLSFVRREIDTYGDDGIFAIDCSPASTTWSVRMPNAREAPSQIGDAVQCGVFSIRWLECRVHDAVADYTLSEMPRLRQLMVLELLQGKPLRTMMVWDAQAASDLAEMQRFLKFAASPLLSIAEDVLVVREERRCPAPPGTAKAYVRREHGRLSGTYAPTTETGPAQFHAAELPCDVEIKTWNAERPSERLQFLRALTFIPFASDEEKNAIATFLQHQNLNPVFTADTEGFVLGLLVEGKIMAATAICLKPAAASRGVPTMNIHGISLDPTLQKKGLGKTLFLAACLCAASIAKNKGWRRFQAVLPNAHCHHKVGALALYSTLEWASVTFDSLTVHKRCKDGEAASALSVKLEQLRELEERALLGEFPTMEVCRQRSLNSRLTSMQDRFRVNFDVQSVAKPKEELKRYVGCGK